MANERHEWFQENVFRHRTALLRYLASITSHGEDLEDLVQETFVRIYALQACQAVESPRALLFRIAHNLAVERARRHISHATDSVADFEELNVYSPEGLPEDRLDERRRFEVFCKAVSQLPPLCRRVFVLRKVYGLSHDEIAGMLGVAESTIEKHVAKGMVRCKKILDDYGISSMQQPVSDRARLARNHGDDT